VLAAGLAFLAGLIIGVVAAAGDDDGGDDTVIATVPAPTTTATTLEEVTTTTTVEGDDDVRTHSGNQENPPQADVGPVECTRDQFGDLKATATVTNHSSERSDYIATIAFESPDGTTQLEASSGFIQDLEPGQSASLEVVTAAGAPAEFTCRVTEVERFASL